MSDDSEIWKDIYYVDTLTGEIIDYRGYYQASNFGLIRSVDRIITQKNGDVVIKRKGKILKTTLIKGYPHVGLHKDGSLKGFQVHRIIASMFVPNPYNLPYVNHKSEVKTESFAENLEWCTHQYNITYGTNRKRRSEKIEKPVSQYTIDNQHVTDYPSAKIAGETNNIFPTSITACCKGRQKKAGGFIWKYAS